jgi:hypothetical protein
MRIRIVLHGLLVALLVQFVSGCQTSRSVSSAATSRSQALLGTRATYCHAPRKPDNRVDVDRLIAELVELRANTYSFCIHGWATDWDDLKLILPAANAKGIRVWASIVPPSESPPRLKNYAEPFRLDYIRWAKEFAKLSLQHTNLVAWSIDDFTHNLKIYTPEYVKEMMDASHRINPRLAFAPCCYYPTINALFATNYVPLLDGILFPYRHESGGANLKDPGLVESELKKLKSICGEKFPIVLDIYATAHSRLGATTPEYVDEAMQSGHRAADGVMIYCHQDPKKQNEAAKFEIVKRNFRAWADEPHRAVRQKNLRGSFGTYDNEPRKKDGRVDVERLATELDKIKANTYNYLVWHATNDWEDLKLFLPLAQARGVRVWVTVVPPTESPPIWGKNYSEPFRLDYARWAVELAKLGLQYTNLVAWSLDDFTDNAGRFEPAVWQKVLADARAVNPRLSFVPCCYYQHLTPEYAAKYRGLVDGILFPYMHAAKGMNLIDTDTVETEVARFKELFGADMPILVDVYATKHSSLQETTPEYVDKVMTFAHGCADGVLIYCHQYEDTTPGKYRVIKKLFGDWNAAAK